MNHYVVQSDVFKSKSSDISPLLKTLRWLTLSLMAKAKTLTVIHEPCGIWSPATLDLIFYCSPPFQTSSTTFACAQHPLPLGPWMLFLSR